MTSKWYRDRRVQIVFGVLAAVVALTVLVYVLYVAGSGHSVETQSFPAS